MAKPKPSTPPIYPYKAVIGLEVHVQLATHRKIFCPEKSVYGRPPNTQLSPITLAHPGTMPMLDRESVSYAIIMCLASHAKISQKVFFDRKSYFYPDLPKGFQITQIQTPIGKDGSLTIDLPTGSKTIAIQHIQIEEDSGKSIHAPGGKGSFINFDRAGQPVLEIVTAPDFSSGEEAAIFLAEMRKMVRYLNISTGDMEKGALRCDANVSIMKETDKVLGTKVELKHMNSMRHVRLAINEEIKRQTRLKQNGDRVSGETRGYDPKRNKTYFQRSKEDLDEYRFFTEPDISPFIVDKAWIKALQEQMPPLPRALVQKFETVYQLTHEDALYLTEQKETSLFFEAVCQHTTHYKQASNWVMGTIKAYLNEMKIRWDQFPVTPKRIAALINIVGTGKVSLCTASSVIFSKLVAQPDIDLTTLIGGKAAQISDPAQLTQWVEEAIARYPDKVAIYQKGKTGLLGIFMKEVMHLSEKRANPKKTMELLREKLRA